MADGDVISGAWEGRSVRKRRAYLAVKCSDMACARKTRCPTTVVAESLQPACQIAW